MSPVKTPDTEVINLPVFDISKPSLETAKAIVAAAEKYGFLYLNPKGTPLSETLVERQFQLSKTFFALPESEKQKCQIGSNNRGWTGMHNEILDPENQRKGDFKEAFNIGEFQPNGQPRQELPECFSDEAVVKELYEFERACKTTTDRLLDLIGLGLEIEGEENWFSKRHGNPSGGTVRLLHYPALPEDLEYSPEIDIRAGAHSDYGSCTLLFQRPGQPGLEIRPPNDTNTWSPVPPFPAGYDETQMPPILVNMGDMMSYWTNGLLRSTVHRVIFPKDTKGGKDRYSIAVFTHPSDDTELVPVPSRLVREKAKENQKNGGVGEGPTTHGYGGGMTSERCLTAREHLLKRLNATYTHRFEQEKA